MYENNLNWQTWLKNGDKYLNAATPKGKKSRFGTDIRYNLLAMSLEKLISKTYNFIDPKGNSPYTLPPRLVIHYKNNPIQ